MGKFKTQRPILMDTVDILTALTGSAASHSTVAVGDQTLGASRLFQVSNTGAIDAIVVTTAGVVSLGTDSTKLNLLGDSVGIHTLYKSSDTVNEWQRIRITGRTYASVTVGAMIAFSDNSLTQNRLEIGGGSGAAYATTIGRIWAAANTTTTAGANILTWSQYGVNVGIAPAVPISGRAFQVTTAGQTTAAYFDNTEGAILFPWDATSAATGQIRIGAASELRLSRIAGEGYVYGVSGNLSIITGTGSVISTVPTGQESIFRVNSVTTATINADGILLPLDGTAANPNIICGAGTDLEIYAGAGNTVVWAHTGLFYLSNDSGQNIVLEAGHATTGDVVITTRAGTEVGRFGANGIELNKDGAYGTSNIILGSTGMLRLYADATNTYLVADTTLNLIQNSNSDFIYKCGAGSGDHIFQTRGANEVGRFDDNGLTLAVDGATSAAANLKIGASADLLLYHTGTNSIIKNTTVGSLYLVNEAASSLIVKCDNAGGGDIFFQTRGAVNRASINANGLLLPLDGGSSTPNLAIGVGSDFTIYHDGSNTYATESTGSLIYRVPSTKSHAFRVNNVGTASIDANGIVLALDGTTGAPNLTCGIGGDLRLFHDGSNSYIETSGVGQMILIQKNGSDMTLQTNHATTGDILFKTRGSTEVARFATNTQLLQSSATGAVPTISLSQSDVSEPFMDFVGTATADALSSISTLNTSGATTDHIQVDVNGVKGWIAWSSNDPT